jgi:hypothetical protein
MTPPLNKLERLFVNDKPETTPHEVLEPNQGREGFTGTNYLAHL